MRGRAVDILALAHVMLSMGIGFSSETKWLAVRDLAEYVVVSQLMLIAFLTWTLPFLNGARLVWLGMMPLAPFIAFNVGVNIAVRLSRAPGYESVDYNYWVYYLLPFAIPAFFAPMVLWIALGLFGWKLDKKDASTNAHTFPLRELLAIVGIWCCGLVLVRDSLSIEALRDSLQTLVMEPKIIAFFAACICIQFVPCIWFAFRHKLIAATLICCGWLVVANLANMGLMYRAQGEIFGDYVRLLTQGWQGLAIVLTTAFIMRWCGYRLVREKNSELHTKALV